MENLSGLEKYPKVEEFTLVNCPSCQDLSSLESLSSLKRLKLESCSLRSKELRAGCWPLEKLELKQCATLKEVSGLGQLSKLKVLSVNGCEQLVHLKGIEALSHLEILNLRGCNQNLTFDFHSLPKLSSLGVAGCFKGSQDTEISLLQRVSGLASLKHLDLSDNDFKELQGLDDLPNLEVLSLANNHNLKELGKLSRFPKLHSLLLMEELDEKIYNQLSEIPKLKLFIKANVSYDKKDERFFKVLPAHFANAITLSP